MSHNCIFNVSTRYKPDVYNTMYLDNKNLLIYGGAGFFGEIQGPCGWKENKKYDCCFTRCSPTWKTRLWPLKVKL